MRKEVYTIAIMSFAGRPVRTFSISKFSLILASIIFTFVSTTGISFVSLKVWETYQKQAQETQAAVQKYDLLKKDFNKLQAELVSIRESCRDFKNLLGVDVTDNNVSKSVTSELSGKGGPEESELDCDNLEIYDESVSDLKTNINFAMREVTSLRSDLNDLIKNASSKLAKLSVVPSICPVWIDFGRQYSISSEYGLRASPFTGTIENHQGLDIPAILGTPAMATADGTVVLVGQSGGYGNFVIIKHDDKYSTVYGHLNNFASMAQVGAKVKRYDIIGYVGSTGRSTGNHLHYEVRQNGQRVNPLDYILN
jgi:hypothetical protein